KGNPLLKHITYVRWAFADVVCDYLLGQNSCALYLRLCIYFLNLLFDNVLLWVFSTFGTSSCLESWSNFSQEECGRYLETIKVYENKPADLTQGQMDTDYLSRLTHALTSVRSVNKTDVVNLGSTFGEDLSHCPGIGERK
ncbi:hypothetical protein CISIN_1g0458231mg, partial [Citrus sinensis]